MTAHWEQGAVSFQALKDLQHEVDALLDFERELFHKAFPGPARPDRWGAL